MEKLNILCYSSKGELKLAYTSTPLEEGKYAVINGKCYEVTEVVQKGIRALSNPKGKIVYLKEYKEKKEN